VVAVLVAWRVPHWAVDMPWRRLLGLSFLVAAAWAVALAVVAGPAAIAAPLTTQFEYLADVDRIAALDLGTYLHTFDRYIVDTGSGPLWAVHVSGHPPLATWVFVMLAKVGLPQAGWAAALCIAGGASAAPSVLSTVRTLAGEDLARAAAPFVAAAPAALWVATSADAFFTGVVAAGICALVHGARRSDWQGGLLALAGGAVLGVSLYLSYGLVLVAPLAVAGIIAAVRVRGRGGARHGIGAYGRPMVLAGVGVTSVVVAVTAAGFWWVDGLRLVVRRIVEGGGWHDRPGAYFAFANLAALAVVVGPAVVAGFPVAVRAAARTAGESWRFLAIPAAALAALAVAQVSTMSLGEVERIWLPWAVWLLPLAAMLPASTRRGWLSAQLGWALLIAATTALKW
jgi:hypothetical protein